MLKIDFGFGAELRADGTPLSADEARLGLKLVREASLRLFGGCTLTPTLGDWRDEDSGQIYSEAGYTLSVLVLAPPTLEARVVEMATIIKEVLDQKAVYVVRHEVQADLY